jgi:carbonic anhydrase/acetyltransferase-like protein (isoleucine patch superfamily)
MLIEHEGKRPRIHPSSRIAPTAVICGDVTSGAETSVGFGAVLTAESGPIELGSRCIVMENAVIRGTRRHPVAIGDHVLIGPQAMFSAAGSARAPSSPPAAPSSTGQKSARGPRSAFTAPCI